MKSNLGVLDLLGHTVCVGGFHSGTADGHCVCTLGSGDGHGLAFDQGIQEVSHLTGHIVGIGSVGGDHLLLGVALTGLTVAGVKGHGFVLGIKDQSAVGAVDDGTHGRPDITADLTGNIGNECLKTNCKKRV